MNYELAKKLKDAGFQFNSYVPVLANDINGNPIEIEENVVDRFPTLSELIEACGEEFKHLGRFEQEISNSSPSHYTVWYVVGHTIPKVEAKTPKEAVANLWLRLNKKNV